MDSQGVDSGLLCGICGTASDFEPQPAAELTKRMRIEGICEQCGNANLWSSLEGSYVDNGDIERDGSEISIMSISSTLTEPELLDLSLPSDLEDDQPNSKKQLSKDEIDSDDSVVDIGIYHDDVLMQYPIEQPAQQPISPPEIDVSAMWTDWPLMQNILILYEERFDELVRVWDVLQRVVLLINSPEYIPQPLLVPEPLHMPDVLLLSVPQLTNLQTPPIFNLATLWTEWTIIQNIFDPQQNLSWPAFEQQMKEFIQVADLFAELVQYDIITPNLL